MKIKSPERRERERTNKCEHCGSIISAVTWTCVLGAFCPGARPSAERVLHEMLTRRAAGDDFPEYPCPEDPDGLHSIGCGCEH